MTIKCIKRFHLNKSTISISLHTDSVYTVQWKMEKFPLYELAEAKLFWNMSGVEWLAEGICDQTR